MLGCNAISAPEQAIASAAKRRLALPESASRESISNAHEITIALSKNRAQSDSISAAPRQSRFEFRISNFGFLLKIDIP